MGGEARMDAGDTLEVESVGVAQGSSGGGWGKEDEGKGGLGHALSIFVLSDQADNSAIYYAVCLDN